MSIATLSPQHRMSHAAPKSLGDLELGLRLLSELIALRVRQHLDSTSCADDFRSIRRQLSDVALVRDRKLSYEEKLVLLLAIAPNTQPDLLDNALASSLNGAGDYPEIGGIRGKQFRGFLPTVQTALFLLAADSLAESVDHMQMFADEHFLTADGLIRVTRQDEREPAFCGQLDATEDFLTQLTTGKPAAPRFSMEFPAQRLTTERTWDDLVLSEETRKGLEHIKLWLRHRQQVLDGWKMSRVFRPSYTCLFFGPPGGGKTMTASLFGTLGYPVYRIDLAMVVSKFIGETEKNLERVFRRAERKNWILFFDEADSLFSKRTSVRDAHDKYANQEVAYLLQRIEQFAGSGLVILASNLKSNIDAAFLRRFQSVVYFPRPEAKDRLAIWNKLLPEAVDVDRNCDLEGVFRRYELSGGSIVNVLQYCLIRAAERKSTRIECDDIQTAIAIEYRKEGKNA